MFVHKDRLMSAEQMPTRCAESLRVCSQNQTLCNIQKDWPTTFEETATTLVCLQTSNKPAGSVVHSSKVDQSI